MGEVTKIELPNGAQMPALGLGTWQVTDEAELKTTLEAALSLGYRHIDTAQSFNNEKIIGDILKEQLESGAVSREDLFVTTKLPGMFMGSGSRVRKGLERSFERLQLEYIDLVQLHTPFGFKMMEDDEACFPHDPWYEPQPEVCDLIETWEALEEFVGEGKIKAIGVSNFNSRQIQRILDIATLPIANNQVECHAYLPQNELFDFLKEKSITMTAFAPFGSPNRPDSLKEEELPVLLEDPAVQEIADRIGKTPAQVLLRNLVQRGIAVVAKSSNPDRLKENLEIFDFELSEDEMSTIAGLAKNIRYFDFKKVAKDHPDYPFNEPF